MRIAEEKHWVAAAVVMSLLAIAPLSGGTNSVIAQAAGALPPPVVMTAEQDHQRLLNLLNITSLRPGANGNNQAPNAANYEESKANPYPNLPDALVLKNGKKVATAKGWWKQRRAEIVEDFDREIYGRVPKVTPKVNWEVSSTTREANTNWSNAASSTHLKPRFR